MEEIDRWERIVTRLHVPSDARESMRSAVREAGRARSRGMAAGAAGQATAADAGSHRTSITSLEKQTDSLMLVSWSDSTRCRYIEQRWVSAKSPCSGYCALTGHAIRRGDSIYRPQWRGGHRPANSMEMILATELEWMDRR